MRPPLQGRPLVGLGFRVGLGQSTTKESVSQVGFVERGEGNIDERRDQDSKGRWM